MLRQPNSAINPPPTSGPAVSATLAPAAQSADRTAALLFIGIGVAEKRERVRHQNSGAEALHRARRDQDVRRRRQRAGERSRREDRKPGHEDFLGADAIAQGAGGQDERGERDGVGR